MNKPDANGWYPIASMPTGEGVRILLYFPRAGPKSHEAAHVSVGTGFISAYQWWQPTHWRPMPPAPAGGDCTPDMFAEREEA